jgi:DNA-binding transcriptional ArsR family regulator
MKQEDPGTQELLVGLQHPLRRAILREMDEKEPTSPQEISQRIKNPLSNVAYHVRVLAENRLVILVRTRPVRGAEQHFYRLDVEAAWARQVLGLDS